MNRPSRQNPTVGRALPSLALAAGALASLAVWNLYHVRKAERHNPPIGQFIEVDGVRLKLRAPPWTGQGMADAPCTAKSEAAFASRSAQSMALGRATRPLGSETARLSPRVYRLRRSPRHTCIVPFSRSSFRRVCRRTFATSMRQFSEEHERHGPIPLDRTLPRADSSVGSVRQELLGDVA